MVIEDYKIVKVYPYMVKGVNSSGEIKFFDMGYALLNQEQRDAQQEYWSDIESEYREAEIRWNIRHR